MTTDNPFLNDLCRRLLEGTVTPCSSPLRQDTTRDDDQEESWITWDGVVSLTSLPLADYSPDELTLLSESLGRSTAINCLEIDAVEGLDWNITVGHEGCTLRELIVTVRSQNVLGVVASAFCRNSSVVRLELDYVEGNQTASDGQNDEVESLVDMSDVYSSINHNLLLEAIKPLQHVIIRGISPQPLPASSHCHTKLCSWQRLTLENCNAAHVATSWIQPAIGSLQRLEITNCRLSPETIESLSEAYLENSAQQKREKHRKRKIYKTPLQVLDLSNNTWGNEENLNGDQQRDDSNDDKDETGVYSFPALSCLASLASWMDSLSNLVELNLSNNRQLFSSSEGSVNMASLCGTVNQSLKRLSLRHCGLTSNDLSLLVSTFCWIEGLDLSENSRLLDNLLPLINLEHLSELVLENMSENGLGLRSSSNANERNQGIGFLLRAIHREESRQEHENNRQCGKGRRLLKRLNLSGNSLDDEALQVMSSLNSLKVLILVGCQMESTSLDCLLERSDSEAEVLPWEELYLQSNNIGDEGVIALACNLKNGRLSSLRVLQLESNVFTMNAMKVLVNDGLSYSRRLVSMTLWPLGAVTSNLRSAWEELEKQMEHYLLLNQAGRDVLFLDSQETTQDKVVHCSNSKKTIPSSLWPFLLVGADQVYGANALYYFLRKRPDVTSSSGQTEEPVDPTKLRTPAQSPKSVMDMHLFAYGQSGVEGTALKRRG